MCLYQISHHRKARCTKISNKVLKISDQIKRGAERLGRLIRLRGGGATARSLDLRTGTKPMPAVGLGTGGYLATG